MAGAVPRELSPEEISQEAGFPLAGAVPPPQGPLASRAMRVAPAPPTEAPSDWIARLVTNLLPSRSAGAEEPAPNAVPAPQGAVSQLSSAVPAGYVRPPMAPWYERMGLVAPATATPAPQQIIGRRG